MESEQSLTGGVSADVVRVGDTVRRAGSAASQAIHEFLTYLYDRGFCTLQRPLGFGEQGREILSYVEGRAGHPPITADIASDDALVAVATAIRRIHDLSVDWDGAAPGRRVWDLAYAAWRLALFADAYGLSECDRAALLDVVRERQQLSRRGMEVLAAQGRLVPLPPTDPRAESGYAAYLDEHVEEWRAALVNGS